MRHTWGGRIMSEQPPSSLDSIHLLADLTSAEREQVARICRWRRYASGEQIIDNQSDTRDVFFVVKGTVRVVNYSASGREVAFNEVSEGGFFGELAAIDAAPRSANVMARDDTVTAALPPEAFIRVATTHPKLALAVMKSLTSLLRTATDRIMDLSTLGANNRVHAEVLRLARAVAPKGARAELKPIPHHSDIASRVSTTRETVARVFSDLTKSKIVKRERDSLVILDMDQLEELVENVRNE